MIGIDTNVLVRLLVADDAAQTQRAQAFVHDALRRDEPGLISLLVLLETEWVLRSNYELDKHTILLVFRRMLESRELNFEDESAIEEALFRWQDAACGFSDCLIAARNRRLGCAATATFDVKALRLPGFVAV